ncbi:MAG: CotH kinase family protein [Clostridia bacterium]|nr:CotH kinase family protein [Clostridia bacterium]
MRFLKDKTVIGSFAVILAVVMLLTSAGCSTHTGDPVPTAEPVTAAPYTTDGSSGTDDPLATPDDTGSGETSTGESPTDTSFFGTEHPFGSELPSPGGSESPSPDESEGPEDPTDSPAGSPGTTPAPRTDAKLSDFAGIVFSKVYGNGGGKDGVCKHSFIELFNTTSKDINLDGLSIYYKTSGDKSYARFSLGRSTIKAHGYYLIRCNSSQTSNEMLKIEKYDASWDVTINNKEIVLIAALYGRDIPVGTEPADVPEKVSYFVASETFYFDTGYVNDMSKAKFAVRTALKPDSGWQVINLGKANSYTLSQIAPTSSKGANVIFKTLLNEVSFSLPAGFYTGTQSLTLSAAAGYKIYYTTDGTDPGTSRTRKLYSAPISLTDTTRKGYGETTQYVSSQSRDSKYTPNVSTLIGGHVVKAYAENGSSKTAVFTSSYFVSSAMKDYGTTVMSVSLPKEVLAERTTGFYLNYYPSTNDPNPRGMAVMEVFDPNGIRKGYSNVELSVSGHGSSGWGMKSLKIYYKKSNNEAGGMDDRLYYDIFDGYATNIKGQSITEFSRLLIRNSGNDCCMTYIRDALMQRLSRTLKLETQSYAPALVFINGEFWGVYNVRERYSGDYVESHYGVDKDNVAVIESDYSQVHTDQNADFVVTSGLDNDADDFNNLVAYIKGNDLTVSKHYKYVTDRLDVDSFIDMYVARLYFSARDWPENNIKVWRNRAGSTDRTKRDTKWYFSLLDMDFGLDYPGIDTGADSNWFMWINTTNCVVGNIMNKLIQNEGFKKQFLSRFYQVVKEVYVPERMEAELDNILAGRKNIFQLQVDRWSKEGASWSNYNSGVSAIRTFLRNRNNYVINYLCAYFNINEAYLMALTGNYVSVSFSDVRLSLKINNAAVTNSWSAKFDGSGTYDLVASAKSGYTVTAIVFTDVDGNVTRKEGASATFTVTRSGTFTVEAKKVSSGSTGLTIQPGIVASGYTLYCLDASGKLYGWGSNVNNILDAGAGVTNVTKPRFIMDNVAKISVCNSTDFENGNTAYMVAAVLTLDGEIYTIGGSSGSLGRTGGSPNAWGVVDYVGNPVDISVGYDHLLVLDKDGTVWGIGNNGYGQLGSLNYQSSAQTFQKVATGAAAISAGRRNSAYIDTNGNCYILGDGRWNKWRSGEDNITTPMKLLSDVSFIASGEHQMVLVTEDGKLYYSGWRDLANFTQGPGSHGPALLVNGGVESASIQYCNLLIKLKSGAVYVYGLNEGGAIGGAVTGGEAAELISSGVAQVAAGHSFSAFLMNNGTIKILGDNSCGQHGIGNTAANAGYSTISVK